MDYEKRDCVRIDLRVSVVVRSYLEVGTSLLSTDELPWRPLDGQTDG